MCGRLKPLATPLGYATMDFSRFVDCLVVGLVAQIVYDLSIDASVEPFRQVGIQPCWIEQMFPV